MLTSPLWIVLIFADCQDRRHSLSIGTGGSGGIFGPGIVIGAFVGDAVWRLGEMFHLPGVPDSPGHLRRGGDDGVFRLRRARRIRS